MEEIFTLFGLSFAMLVGCYLAGIIPLAVNLSEKKLKFVTVLGAGLLVGTALSVIVPEGVHAMYSTEDHHDHNTKEVLVSKGSANANVDSSETHGHGEVLVEKHSIIGISLVTGFVFMLLVDQIGGKLQKHSAPTEAQPTESGHGRNRITATLGLVVHAAADGVALGAAISLSQSHVTVIVFLAIMLHKAPAAFGLVSFLLHEGFDRSTIRKHLAIFSASAPLLTIITYAVLIQQREEAAESIQTTGIAMLFSAGTFLYVATVHVLPEVAITHIHYQAADGTFVVKDEKGFKNSELCTLVIGSVLPLCLTFWHKH